MSIYLGNCNLQIHLGIWPTTLIPRQYARSCISLFQTQSLTDPDFSFSQLGLVCLFIQICESLLNTASLVLKLRKLLGKGTVENAIFSNALELLLEGADIDLEASFELAVLTALR